MRGPKSKRDLKLSEIKERNGSLSQSKIYEILFKIGDYKSSNNNSKLGDKEKSTNDLKQKRLNERSKTRGCSRER